jgi:hypothetical protein
MYCGTKLNWESRGSFRKTPRPVESGRSPVRGLSIPAYINAIRRGWDVVLLTHVLGFGAVRGRRFGSGLSGVCGSESSRIRGGSQEKRNCQSR